MTHRKQNQKRYAKSAKGKAANARYARSVKGRKSARRFYLSAKGKAWRKQYYRLHTTKESIQQKWSRIMLKAALKSSGPINRGWPDAGRIEQKVGTDHVRFDQWRRAAHEKSKGNTLKLFFAKSHEDAVVEKGITVSFEKYAKSIGLLVEWQLLVCKEGKHEF